MRDICPYCHGQLEIVVRAIPASARASTAGPRRRGMAQRYEFAAQQLRADAAPVAPVATDGRFGLMDLLYDVFHRDTPGHTIETRRPPQMSDVLVPAAYAAIGGALLGIGGLALALAGLGEGASWRWLVPPSAWVGGTISLWLLSSRDLMRGAGHLLAHVERIAQVDIDGDGVIGDEQEPEQPPAPQVHIMEGRLSDGQRSIYTRFGITKPVEWCAFCRAVMGGKNFSETEATKHHVPPAEYKRIVTLWASPDPEKALIDIATIGERSTPELTRMGKAMVKLFATTTPVAEEF